MKKFAVIILALALALGMTSCGNNKNDAADTTAETTTAATTADTTTDTTAPETTAAEDDTVYNIDEMSCEDIVGVIYKGSDEYAPMTGITEITPDNSEYYVGIANLETEQAVASEAMISSIAHSIVVMRFAEGTDIDAMKTDIKAKVNPRKWICVGVDDDKVIVDSIGNVVVLILDQEYGENYHANFLKLAK
ncbi:MAG: hypothetical protein WCQ72_04475 [Eubacteriales bacterium]